MNKRARRRALRGAAVAEQHLLDLRRVRHARHDDRAFRGDAGRIAAVVRAERRQPFDGLAIAVRAHRDVVAPAQKRCRHRLAHRPDTDHADLDCHRAAAYGARNATACARRQASDGWVPKGGPVPWFFAFVRLSRPLFLYGGFAGVALGAAVAHAQRLRLDVATYLWAQALVTSFQLMVHYANDYFDREADAQATPMRGPAEAASSRRARSSRAWP